MTHSCEVYGLGLRVNVPLAGLRGLRPAGRVDVSIEVGSMPAIADEAGEAPFYATDERDESGAALATVRRIAGGRYFRIDYLDGTRVLVEADGSHVWATGQANDAEETATYLLGPVLGFVLRLRGVNCLHASAVAIDGRAVAFAGASGSGKSSIAAAFARRGNAVMADDVTPLAKAGDGFMVRPAYPRLRLWPESVEALFGSPEAMPRIIASWDKRAVDLASAPFSFQHQALPLAAVYRLDAAGGAAAIHDVCAKEALMGLVADSYTSGLIDRDMRAREFEFLAGLVATVPIRRLSRGSSLADVECLCELVERDLEAVAAH